MKLYFLSWLQVVFFQSYFCILGTVTTFAGGITSGSNDGVGTNSKFYQPYGLAVHPVGTLLYVADANNIIRTIALYSGI